VNKDLRTQLERLREDAQKRLAEATDAPAVDALRIALLGRSGELTALLHELGSVDPGERAAIGQLANAVRTEVETAIRDRLAALQTAAMDEQLAAVGVPVVLASVTFPRRDPSVP